MTQETTPLRAADEDVEPGLGSFICCRMMAPLGIPALEQHRHKLLYTAHFLCGLGVLLTALAYIGAFAWGAPLSYLSWTSIHGPKGTVHAGVTWVCHDGPTLDAARSFLQGAEWKCGSLKTIDCSMLSREQESYCGLCKSSSTALTFTVFISLFTYYGFFKKTSARLNGEDSSFTKFMACFAALIAGVNFLAAITAYWKACIGSLAASHPGPGLICMTVAAVLKVLMGFVHLCLPVERGSKDI